MLPIKLIFAFISVAVGTTAFLPYIRDIFLKKTQPHAYTWFIWILTQGTALAGLLYGGGGIGGLELIIGTVMMCLIFLLSFKYGTRNITLGDTVILIAVLSAIIIWWQLKNPFLSILLICIIDVLGYIPSYRKAFQEPWSETVLTFILFVVGNCFAIAALKEYNFLTLSYLIAISAANTVLIVICLIRRRVLTKINTVQISST